MKNENRELTPEMRDELLITVKMRFEMNMKRHEDVIWY